MDSFFEKTLRKYAKAHSIQRKWIALILPLIVIVAISTSYALINPATSQKAQTHCGQEEHVHTNECYEQTEVLCCPLSEEGHVHTDECYALILSCGMEETDGGERQPKSTLTRQAPSLRWTTRIQMK